MDLFIYTHIGTLGGKRGFLAEDVVNYLANNEGEEVTVRINSVGGEVYEGYAIYNLLINSGRKVIIYIDGICASIASFIAMAGDEIYMNEMSQVMIHKPLMGLEGNADDLRKGADELDQIESTIISAYRKRSKVSEESLAELMRKETYLDASTAKELGFADSVIVKKAVAFIDPLKIGTLTINKMEKSLLDKVANLLEKVEAKLTGKPLNMDLTLSDGTGVYIETQVEGEITAGDKVFITKEDGSNEPAPDGDHELADGKIVKTEGGAITEIMEPEMEVELAKEEPKAEEADAEKEEMKAKIEELTNALNAKEEEVKAVAEKFDLLNDKINALEKMTIGTSTNVVTKTIVNKIEPTITMFDSFAETLKSKLVK